MVLQDHPACQPDKGEVSIDTLSFTLDLGAIVQSPAHWQLIASGLDNPQSNDNFYLWHAFQQILDGVFGERVFQLEENFKSGRNFFQNSITIMDGCGFIAFGGNNTVVDHTGKEQKRHERMQVYITGEGCRRVPDWRDVYTALSQGLEPYQPKITRVDIAYDDHDGIRDVDFAADSYRAGLFAGNGRPPKGQRIDDMGSGDGCTFYVGSRESGRYLRIYEKGKQLGDKESSWVRWEVELSAKQVVIPLRVLLHPRQFLAGSYPCLDWISRARYVIETAKRREQIEFQHLVNHGRRGYGALVNYMLTKRSMTPDQIVSALVRDGVPGRLVWTTSDDIRADSLPFHTEQHPHLYAKAPDTGKRIPDFDHGEKFATLRYDWVMRQANERKSA